jgi:hypothetical protein
MPVALSADLKPGLEGILSRPSTTRSRCLYVDWLGNKGPSRKFSPNHCPQQSRTGPTQGLWRNAEKQSRLVHTAPVLTPEAFGGRRPSSGVRRLSFGGNNVDKVGG